MSIGSLAPTLIHNCARRITFENIDFEYPLKAIYVKTNPCSEKNTQEECSRSSGEMTDIMYNGINAHNPLWWGIYIGPQ